MKCIFCKSETKNIFSVYKNNIERVWKKEDLDRCAFPVCEMHENLTKEEIIKGLSAWSRKAVKIWKPTNPIRMALTPFHVMAFKPREKGGIDDSFKSIADYVRVYCELKEIWVLEILDQRLTPGKDYVVIDNEEITSLPENWAERIGFDLRRENQRTFLIPKKKRIEVKYEKENDFYIKEFYGVVARSIEVLGREILIEKPESDKAVEIFKYFYKGPVTIV